jgi:hypothetical protein
MKIALIGLALCALGSAAQAQTRTPDMVAPPANPLAVTPIEPARPSQETPEAAAIRSKMEALGYTNITGLERDGTGLWHAQATLHNATVSIVVDKGGRIIRH